MMKYLVEGLFKLFGEVGSDIAGLFDVVKETGLGTKELFTIAFHESPGSMQRPASPTH